MTQPDIETPTSPADKPAEGDRRKWIMIVAGIGCLGAIILAIALLLVAIVFARTQSYPVPTPAPPPPAVPAPPAAPAPPAPGP